MKKYSIFLCLCICVCMKCVWCSPFKMQSPRAGQRVCVIGAGIAGLTSARYLKEEGIKFTVLEATKYIGGTWRFDPRVGTDENGLPLFTSMYKTLRTNLPKPAMELRGYPIPEEIPSFPSWKLYYEYIKSYAKHYELEKHIKFLHMVISVKRIDNVWKVTHRHVITGKLFEDEFDYVFVGTGHFSKPNLPNIPGEHLFKGSIIHSHDYKEPSPYKGRRVLVIGAGPSGMEIGLDLTKHARTIIHSHHSVIEFRSPFPSNYIRKPDVEKFTRHGVVFVDGTYEELEDVIYCTGFQYDYSFLDDSCELDLSPRTVIPLYKYMVNINQPTMIVMGLVVRACLVVAIDAQARYATALVKGNFTLPSKEEMIEDWNKHAEALISQGRPLSDLHLLAGNEDQYYADLAKESGIERVPPVMFKIRVVDTEAKIENLSTYRNYVYTVLDKENFTRSLENDLVRQNDCCTP